MTKLHIKPKKWPKHSSEPQNDQNSPNNWLSSGSFREKILGPLNRRENSLKLCDLWDSSNNWCFENLSLVQDIKAIPRPLVPHSEDRPFWHLSRDGQFSSKSTYKVALNWEDPCTHSSNCNWIWKLNTLPQIAYFIWLACHGRLTTKALIMRKRILQDDACPLCKAALDSPLHILRDCPCAISLWLMIGLSLLSIFFFFFLFLFFRCQGLNEVVLSVLTANFSTLPYPSKGHHSYTLLGYLGNSKQSRFWLD